MQLHTRAEQEARSTWMAMAGKERVIWHKRPQAIRRAHEFGGRESTGRSPQDSRQKSYPGTWHTIDRNRRSLRISPIQGCLDLHFDEARSIGRTSASAHRW